MAVIMPFKWLWDYNEPNNIQVETILIGLLTILLMYYIVKLSSCKKIGIKKYPIKFVSIIGFIIIISTIIFVRGTYLVMFT